MRICFTIARNELKLLWRNKTFINLGAILLLLTAFTILSSTTAYRHAENEHTTLTDTARSKMVNQKPRSAHMAGHYGHIAFKPATFLQAIDPGVTVFTGTTVRIEAHRQNQAVFSSASGQSSLVRFGEFSFSLLLQVVVPLLILFTCYRAVITDRGNGTLKLLLCQGISMRTLVGGKILAYSMVFMGYLLLASIAYGTVFSFQHAGPQGSVVLRILTLLILYGCYYIILVSFTVYFSARAKDASGLLAGLLAVWFVLTIILPKAAANIGEQRAPLPTSFELTAQIKERKKDGINGHDKKNPHTIAFVDSVLKVYQADSVKQLPVKIGGLLMQADEDFNNMVYDEAMNGINSGIARQNQVGSLTAVVNPFMAVKHLSMAVAGTDMYHHFDFTSSVEQYRRELIRRLNAQDALRESAFKDSEGKLKGTFWKQTADFSYQPPVLGWSLAHYPAELLSLLLWVVFTAVIVYFRTNKIQVS